MTHRIREAMKTPLMEKLGGLGKVVEADETYWGNKGKQRKGARGWSHKEKIFSLVEREGKVLSFHVPYVNARTLGPILREYVDQRTSLFTDDASQYQPIGRYFAKHRSVAHSRGEYGRGPVHTNTIEGFFGNLKRGLKGIYQQVSKQHLHRYLHEFEFRRNHRHLDDLDITREALRGAVGKRLIYMSWRIERDSAAYEELG